jgi:hypothetical protein
MPGDLHSHRYRHAGPHKIPSRGAPEIVEQGAGVLELLPGPCFAAFGARVFLIYIRAAVGQTSLPMPAAQHAVAQALRKSPTGRPSS